MILGESQEHGIVEQATLGVGDEDVFALTDLHRRQVAAGEQLGEAGGVRAGDLDLALDGDVAEDRLVDEIPEVLLRIPEVARMYMWLYVEKPVAPQRTVASKYGDLRIWVPKPKSAVSAWRGWGVPELGMGRRLRLNGKGDAAGHAPTGDHRTVLAGATDDDHLDIGGGLGHRDESSSLRRCIHGAQARSPNARFSSLTRIRAWLKR